MRIKGHHIYLAEAADSLDLRVSGKENTSDALGLLGLLGGGWLWRTLDDDTKGSKIQRVSTERVYAVQADRCKILLLYSCKRKIWHGAREKRSQVLFFFIGRDVQQLVVMCNHKTGYR